MARNEYLFKVSLLLIITNEEIGRKKILPCDFRSEEIHKSASGRKRNRDNSTTPCRIGQFVMRLLLERIEAEPRYH